MHAYLNSSIKHSEAVHLREELIILNITLINQQELSCFYSYIFLVDKLKLKIKPFNVVQKY